MAAWQRMEYPRDKGACYRLLGGQLAALMEGERDALANLANAAALIYQALPDLNWAGFYLYKQGMLVLGPFQGMPACVRIPFSRGVCGAAAACGVGASCLSRRPRVCAGGSCTRCPMRSGKVSAGSAWIFRRITASAASTAAAGTMVFHISLPSSGQRCLRAL